MPLIVVPVTMLALAALFREVLGQRADDRAADRAQKAVAQIAVA